ncbi:MAG: histidine kinase, partial [Gloeobacteraceae cyanobacterium ES-bin-316]|nr:histidine kinase [Ferruginibacter sp.]
SINDGLVSNYIRRLFQDSKGFLWIATYEGLSRYDGHSFTNYSTANGLPHNMVNDFYESDGLLHISLNNGEIAVIENNKIRLASAPNSPVINRFLPTPWQQVIVITDREGVQEFSKGKLRKPRQSFPLSSITDIALLNDTSFITAGENTIRIYDYKYYLLAEINEGIDKFQEIKIYRDSKKRIWAGTSRGLKLLQESPKKNEPFSYVSLPASFKIPALQQKIIKDILEDADGTMWFGTTGGLVKIKPDGSHKILTVNDGLPSNIITSLFQDKEKNIWLGTALGLCKLVTGSGISLYPIENGVWSSDNLYLMHPFKKDRFLVGTHNGMQVFNKLTGSFTSLRNNTQKFFDIVQNSQPPVLIGLDYLATFDSVKLQFDKTSALPSYSASRIIRDKAGNIFYSSLNQLFLSDEKKTHTIFDYRVSGLLIDKAGYLWVGTWQDGLFRLEYQFANNHFSITETKHFLPTEDLRSVFEDSQGSIWAGTRYHGVYRLTKSTHDSFSISHYNQQKGLTSNWIKNIGEDGNGNFWLANYHGLDKLIAQDSGFRVFNFSRVNNYFASIVGMQTDTDHSIWLATNEGLAHITDGQFEKNPPLPVYITKVFSADSSYPLNEKKIKLTYLQKQVQFEFSSPGFINEKQVMYSYRLVESTPSEWSAPANQHSVSYASLQPGNYRFEVRTLGWNGAWGKTADYEFSIEPPFWETWWFRSLVVIVVASIIYGLIKQRIKTIRHEAEMKQKIAETEMMALRAQMNPHFIFNCLNSIDNLIQMDEKENATLYLSKFAKLIRAILENSANNAVPCWKDLETLELYLELEALRFDHKFSYKITIADEILNGDYKVPPLIIQPFVENALHHGLLNKLGGDKKLFVNVFASADHIQYSIEDNGIGRKMAATYKQQNELAYGSMGMQITEERINIFNQQVNGSVKINDLVDEQNNALGTKVEVRLNIQS